MRLTIIAVGRARDADEAHIVARYLARMRPKPELIEIDGRKSRDAMDEWRQIEARIPSGAARVLLDERGRDLPSPNVKCFLIDPNGYLAPYPAFKAPVLAGVPFAFTLVQVLSIKRLSGLGQP